MDKNDSRSKKHLRAVRSVVRRGEYQSGQDLLSGSVPKRVEADRVVILGNRCGLKKCDSGDLPHN